MVRRDWYCEDVLSGNMPVNKVWEDDLVLAFHCPDTLPADTHVLVIPKKHVSSVLASGAVDVKLLASMMLSVQKVAAALGIDKTGFFVSFYAGSPGVTPHLHWHIKAPIPTS
jgi:histidine triad (HIT) family protein